MLNTLYTTQLATIAVKIQNELMLAFRKDVGLQNKLFLQCLGSFEYSPRNDDNKTSFGMVLVINMLF